MNDLDFSFFLEPPREMKRVALVIEALIPLSMTAEQPGTYYQSLRGPTDAMLYGMLENALGWHFWSEEREINRKTQLEMLRKEARKQFKRGDPALTSDWLKGVPDESGVGFFSLLQYHFRFVEPRIIPQTIHFNDLWARHVHEGPGARFMGGSRNNDYRVEHVLIRAGRQEIELSDRSEYNTVSSEAIRSLPEGAKVHYKSVRASFPLYYVSPTPREYVIPLGPFRFAVECTSMVAELIEQALASPAAPLYLGTNDGWVEARLEEL